MHLLKISEHTSPTQNIQLEQLISSYFIISDDRLSITYIGKGLNQTEIAVIYI